MIDSYFNKEDKMLIANILDKYKQFKKTGNSTYSNFLNNEKLKIVCNYLDYQKIPYSIYEPYPFLEKKIIYFGEYSNFITFYKVKINNDIKHSNILGTLFSLGLDDSLIGDIFVEKGYFYYTNLTRFNSFLETNLVLIKNQVVTLEKTDEITLLEKHFEIITILVSSMRLDNILSKLTSKSRSQVINLINDKLVLLNYKEVKNSSILLKENDILSIRKYGKYKIGNVSGFTKKNNIVLEIIKYI